MTNETHRFFRLTDRDTYDSLCAYVDGSRGYPDGNGTERGLPVWDKLFTDPETGTDKLYCLDRWRFADGNDEAQLQAALDAGVIEEIDLAIYTQRLQWEPPIEEELPMDFPLDELYLPE